MSKTNDEKVNELFLNNMKLVPFVYKKNKKKFPLTPSIDANDLIQEGYISLFNACKNYDETKGKFSTYAYFCIYGGMRNFCDDRNIIHIPNYKLMDFFNYIKDENSYNEEFENIKALLDITQIADIYEIDDIYENQVQYEVFTEEYYNSASFIDVWDIAKHILSEREFNIVYDYIIEEDNTLESLGKKYKLSISRIRQIVRKSLYKLSKNSKLKSYLNYL